MGPPPKAGCTLHIPPCWSPHGCSPNPLVKSQWGLMGWRPPLVGGGGAGLPRKSAISIGQGLAIQLLCIGLGEPRSEGNLNILISHSAIQALLQALMRAPAQEEDQALPPPPAPRGPGLGRTASFPPAPSGHSGTVGYLAHPAAGAAGGGREGPRVGG